MFTINFKLSLLLAVVMTSVLFAQNPLLNEKSVKFENATTISLAGDNGLVMRTTNNGETWIEQETNITNVLYGISIYGSVSLAAGENGVIIRSTDHGVSWEPILPGTLEDFNDVELKNTNAVVCGNNGTLYYSTNSGLTWNTAVTNTTVDLYDVHFVNNLTGFITGKSSTFLRTTDGGLSWEIIDMPMGNYDFNSIGAIDENNFTIVGNNGKIYLTNDGGLSWHGPSMMPMYEETDFNDIVYFNSTDGAIAASDGVMLKTTDGGETWYESLVNISGDLYDYYAVTFNNNSFGVAVGANGMELYSTDGGSTWLEQAPKQVLNNSRVSIKPQLNQNYPNPFNPATNISFTLPYSANVSLKVYDIAGKEVADLMNGFNAEGSYNVSFNASNLSSGVYFYKLAVNSGVKSFTQVNKMILTK